MPDDPTVARRYLTTKEAAFYCGFRTTGGARKAVMEGRLQAAGRRGGAGTLMFALDETSWGLAPFDASDWETDSEEEPNALRPEDVPWFLGALKERCPKHYAMSLLGFTTGLRPSSLRPPRRQGAQGRRVLVRGTPAREAFRVPGRG